LGAGVAFGGFVLAGAKARPMAHVAMLGDSVFDNSSYVGGAPDVRAQVQALLPGLEVSSAARDGAIIADIQSQLDQLPPGVTHLVVSIGGNDAIRASGVIEESASTVSVALDKLASIRERFAQGYLGMVRLLLKPGIPVALCTIYEPRFPEINRRRAAATALTTLNDAITRHAFLARASLIDLRIICDADDDFANPIEPSAIGGAKIARAIADFAVGGQGTSLVFGAV